MSGIGTHLEALLAMGLQHANQGNLEAALLAFGQAVELAPGDPRAHFNVGVAMQALGQLEHAADSYRRAIAVQPEFTDAWYNLGYVLRRQGRLGEALAAYGEATRRAPTHFGAQMNRGNLLREMGGFGDAIAHYDTAISLRPDYLDAHFARAISCFFAGRFDQALEGLDALLLLSPGHLAAVAQRAATLVRLDRHAEAVSALDTLDASRAATRDEHHSLGLAYWGVWRLEASLHHLDEALRVDPGYGTAHHDRGILLVELGRHEEAEQSLQNAVSLLPGFRNSRYILSLVQLRRGDFKSGWTLHESRFGSVLNEPGDRYGCPQWRGERPIAGKTLLLHWEQGLGDSLQFLRYAAAAADEGGRVLLAVQKPLLGIARSLPGIERVIDAGDKLPPLDFHCPLMSLPLAFGADAPPPLPSGYLRADTARAAEWAERLGPRTRPRIGLTWAGNPKQGRDRTRSFRLAQWIDSLPRHLDYVSLHKELHPDDQATLDANPWIRHYGDEQADFQDAAALVHNMDLVLTVDTSMAHLVGALGHPVWILLAHAPDWRWQLGAETTPWYASARLWRQSRRDDWQGVFNRMAQALSEQFPSP